MYHLFIDLSVGTPDRVFEVIECQSCSSVAPASGVFEWEPVSSQSCDVPAARAGLFYY